MNANNDFDRRSTPLDYGTVTGNNESPRFLRDSNKLDNGPMTSRNDSQPFLFASTTDAQRLRKARHAIAWAIAAACACIIVLFGHWVSGHITASSWW